MSPRSFRVWSNVGGKSINRGTGNGEVGVQLQGFLSWLVVSANLVYPDGEWGIY